MMADRTRDFGVIRISGEREPSAIPLLPARCFQHFAQVQLHGQVGVVLLGEADALFQGTDTVIHADAHGRIGSNKDKGAVVIDRISSFFDAITQCWILSRTCVPDWAAWSGWSGWVGALGGWAGALATFLAVLLPYRRERRRAHFRAKVTLSSFLSALGRLSTKLDGISSIRVTLEHGDYRPSKQELEAMLSFQISFPVLDAEPELVRVIADVGNLQREVETWIAATHPYAFGPRDPVEPITLANLRPMYDALTDRLHDAIERTEAAIVAAVPGIKAHVARIERSRTR